eukprot:6193484-Pleurochrysis_carterae.AAC.2
MQPQQQLYAGSILAPATSQPQPSFPFGGIAPDDCAAPTAKAASTNAGGLCRRPRKRPRCASSCPTASGSAWCAKQHGTVWATCH